MDRGKFERLFNDLLIILQAFTVGLVGDLVRIGHRLKCRTILKHKLKCTFFTDARGARNIVDGIAHQSEKVDDLFWRQTEFVFDPSFVTPFDRRNGYFSF